MKIFKLNEIILQIPNLIFRNRLKFNFEYLPFESKNISWKKKWNFFKAGLNQYFLPQTPIGYPVIAQVEPANICNLKCTLCVTSSVTGSRPATIMPFSTFKKFIDDVGDYLLLIILWNWGEPFLNPEITEMIEYATKKGILVHTSTNGNVVFDDAMAEKIVDSGLTSIVFAMDGATQETYEKYRVGGDLERIKENIRTLVRTKKKKNSHFPQITLRFVAMRQNEEEWREVEKYAHELGVDLFSIKSVDMPDSRGEHLDTLYRPENEDFRRYDYEKDSFIRKKKKFVCMRPWKRITLDAMGEVISCEYDYKNLYSWGNIKEKNNVMDAWKSKEGNLFRKKFNKGHNSFEHCVICTYKNISIEQCIICAYRVGQAKNVGN